VLSQPKVQRYAVESGLRDIMIAEKEVVLTFLLQLLSEHGILDRFAFKGGTCLRKMVIGSQGRFSTDLDFTGLEEHDHETVVLDMMTAFEETFHGIGFTAMIRPRNCEEASSWDKLLAYLADPEFPLSEAFKG
jgi:predicted nucleotidyltransferase component of viral defense system